MASDAISVSAFGGFTLGADALDNPSTDPSITSAYVANTVVSTTLVSVETTVATTHGEGETATGQDFPVTYNTVITPASATAGNALNNFATTITLPPDVILSGDTTPAGEKIFTQAELDAAKASGVLNITANGIDTTGATFTPGTTKGSIIVTFPTLQSTSATQSNTSQPDVTVAVKTYVGQTGADNSSILGDNGASKQIVAPTVTYSADPWGAGTPNPVTIQNDQGDTSQAQVTAKAFALQSAATDATRSDGYVLPNDAINYATSIQISDYGSATVDKNFVITQTLNDGQTIDPNSPPTFTYTGGKSVSLNAISTEAGATNVTTTTLNGDTVYTSGSNEYWSFTRDNTTGKTTVTFNIGQAIGDGLLPAGTTGTLNFQAKALSAYTPKAGDTATRVITEQDSIKSDVTGSVTLNTLNGHTPETDTSLSDDSGTQLTVPTGKAQIEIVAVNGKDVTTTYQADGTSKLTYADGSTVLIQPNDKVTYASTYALQSGDYNDLTLTSYLPQGTFSTTNPTEASGGSTFTAAGTGSTGYPETGEYKLISAPDGVSIVGTPTTDATSNNLGFTFSQKTSPSAGTPITVQFTVTASKAVMANGLPLTALVQGTLTNGSGTTVSDQRVIGTTLAEPSLSTTTGIVSVVDDNNNAKAVSYTNSSTAPNSIFQAAGSNGNAFVDNSVDNASILNANDLNVGTGGTVQVDGGDTVRVATTVQNTGQYAAYDVTLAGGLPSGVNSTDSISHFQVYTRDASGKLVGVYTDDASAAQAATNYFSTGGLSINSATATDPVLYGTNDTTHPNQNVLFVVYDVKLPQTTAVAQTLTDTGSILSFSNTSGGGNFVTQTKDASGNITGLSAPEGNKLTDTASVDLAKPTLDIYSGPSDNPDDDNNTTTQFDGVPEVTGGNVVVGETRPITLKVNTPEGTLTGANGEDVTVTATLPNGMTLASSPNVTITLPDGTSVANPNYTYDSAKGTLVFDLGKTVTNSNVDTSKPVTITFNTTVSDTDSKTTNPTKYAGKNKTYDITAQLNYLAGESDSGHVKFTQVVPVLGTGTGTDLQATLTPDAKDKLYSGQEITYTYSVTNSGLAVAEGINQTLQLDPKTLQLVAPGTLTVTGSKGSVITLTPDTTNDTLTYNGAQLKAGETLNFTFKAIVQDNQAAGTKDTIQSTSGSYTTMPNGAGHTFTFGASATSTVNTFQNVNLSIVGESNGELSSTPSETNPLHSVATPVGDIVRLQGTTEVPEGKTDGVKLTVNIPNGMTIPDLSNNSVTIAFVTPAGAGALVSSTLDSTGTNTTLQQTAGTAGAGVPTYTLDSSHVTVNPDGKSLTIDLGSLSNNGHINATNKVIFEFNAIVSNTTDNTNGKHSYTQDSHGNDEYNSQAAATQHTAQLNVSYTGNTSGITSDGSHSVTQTVVEPHLTLTKDETAFDAATNTATYTVTVTNNGDATAHQVIVADKLSDNTTLLSNALQTAGDGSVSNATLDATNGLAATISTLAVGQSESFTYQVKLKDITQGPSIINTTATYDGLATETPQTLTGTTGTAIGTAEGGRNGTADPTDVDFYYAKASSQFSIVTGTLYDSLGNINPNAPAYNSTVTDKGAVDHYLPGVEVTATYTDPATGKTVTTAPVKTDEQGRFRFAGIPNADVTISVVSAPTGETNVVAYHGGTGATDGKASVTIHALDGKA